MDENDLTPLDPNYVKVLRIVTALIALPFVIGGVVLEVVDLVFPGAFLVPIVLAALFLIVRFPLRRYAARGYQMGSDRLRVVKGLLFRSDTIVPFGRIQHIDVDRGPLERYYKLASLTVHTAGNHNASVRLPGLAHEDALAMREDIRAHIRRDTL